MMEIEEHSQLQGEVKFTSNRVLNNDMQKEEVALKSKELINEDNPTEKMIAQNQFSQKINNFRRKCIKLGLEENELSPSNHLSFKEKYIASHLSDSESENEMPSKLDTSLSENYASLSSSAEDSVDEVTDKDCNMIDTDKHHADNSSLKEEITKSDNVIRSIADDLETESLVGQESTLEEKNTNQSLSLLNNSVSKKRKFLEDNGCCIESIQEDLSPNLSFPSEKYLKMDLEDVVSKNRLSGLSNQCSVSKVDLKVEKEPATLKSCIKTSFKNKNSSQSQLTSKSQSAKAHANSNALSNILDRITTTFARQLNTLNLENLTPSQASLLKEVLENKTIDCIPTSNDDQRECTPDSSPSGETSNRLSIDTDDMLPIQAEVVMSDDSDCEHNNRTPEQTVDRDVENYVNSFMECPSQGSILEYHPLSNEVPKDGSDLVTWQLENVSLPPFKPFVQPPNWLRFTIPADGYKCDACGDMFFIESSLIQHKERRSVWINVECGPCDAKLTFYNKCAYKIHLQHHEAKGELMDDVTVEVRTLPLQLTKLLQPIIVPVPQISKAPKNRTKGSPCKTLKKGIFPSQGFTPGKENLSKLTSTINAALSLTSLDDRNNAFSDSTDFGSSTVEM